MRTLRISFGGALLAAVLALPLAARAEAGFKEVSPDQVEKMLGAPDVRVYDINDATMYDKYHVPGAVHVGNRKLETLLPADKTTRLVFYCSNTL
jgi:rhodanese-related sulfurtransferase